jgi:sugar (pentulose or hexulose) kinase
VTATEVVIGVDLGTTSSKAMVRDMAGREVALVAARTPWTTVHGGTQTTADALLALAVDVLGEAVGAAEGQIGAVRVLGVGLAGLGESGVLLDAGGEPCAPVIAWFDKRGGREMEVLGATAYSGSSRAGPACPGTARRASRSCSGCRARATR